jgi:hypothetical protein
MSATIAEIRIRQLVQEGLRKRKAGFGKVALGAALVACTAFVVGLLSTESGDALMVGLLFASVPAIVAGLTATAWVAVGDPKDGAFVRMLRERRAEIVWAYAAQVEQRVGPTRRTFHNVWLYCGDGKGAMAPVPARVVVEVVDLLRRELPSASIGWSEQRLSSFRRDPMSLARRS